MSGLGHERHAVSRPDCGLRRDESRRCRLRVCATKGGYFFLAGGGGGSVSKWITDSATYSRQAVNSMAFLPCQPLVLSTSVSAERGSSTSVDPMCALA